jgi:hypothetical protein
VRWWWGVLSDTTYVQHAVTYIHTYIHAYIHTYIRHTLMMEMLLRNPLWNRRNADTMIIVWELLVVTAQRGW